MEVEGLIPIFFFDVYNVILMAVFCFYTQGRHNEFTHIIKLPFE